ncbi:hypothetical protein D3C78_1698470 [compost metagenome]
MCQDLPHTGVLFVHRAFADDKSQDTARLEQVQRTDEKVVMNVVAAAVAAIMDANVMKGNVGEHGIKTLFAPINGFKSLDVDVCLGIELS